MVTKLDASLSPFIIKKDKLGKIAKLAATGHRGGEILGSIQKTKSNEDYLVADNGIHIVSQSNGQVSFSLSTDSLDILVNEHFVSSNASGVGIIGSSGWTSTNSGAGAATTAVFQTGHSGICRLDHGTTSTGYSAIDLGNDSNSTNTIGITNNKLTFKTLVSWNDSISSADLKRSTIGLSVGWRTTYASANNLGIFFRLEPGVSTSIVGVCRRSGNETIVPLVVPVINNWYRLEFEATLTSVRFSVNGVFNATQVTTNIPLISEPLGPGFRQDAVNTNTSKLLIDYVLITQITSKET